MAPNPNPQDQQVKASLVSLLLHVAASQWRIPVSHNTRTWNTSNAYPLMVGIQTRIGISALISVHMSHNILRKRQNEWSE